MKVNVKWRQWEVDINGCEDGKWAAEQFTVFTVEGEAIGLSDWLLITSHTGIYHPNSEQIFHPLTILLAAGRAAGLGWSGAGSICVIRFHHNPPVTNLHGGMFVIKLLSHRIYFSNLPRPERVIWLCWGILFWRSATNQPSNSCPHITRKWYSHFLSFHKRSHTREEVAWPVS